MRKGRIIQIRTRSVHQFMFNPASVRTSHGWSWGKMNPLGMSSPLLTGGAGNDFSISFQLMLDADRGYYELRRAGQYAPTSLALLLEYYRGLTHPERPPAEASFGFGGGGTPPDLVLSLGEAWLSRVPCVAESVSVEVTAMDPDSMDPLRATIDLAFAVRSRRVVYQDDLAGETIDDQDRDAGGRRF